MQFLKCGDGIFITASIEVDRPQLHDPIIRIVWVEPHGLVHDLNALRCTPRKAETLAEVIENIRIIRIELQSPLICGYGAIMVSAKHMITCKGPITPGLVVVMLDSGSRKFQGLCHRE